ncbi:MAG: GTP cyclohydrolase I FolE [Ignavibacteriaceae bacterium]|jgi:GTP cyclohydrolase I|nr:GTP cyclohydrolase I FolE [Ignavibacteriaceae bacterium]MCW8814205.1 GTP cyclohydrolase I FolE [Chlorobium sp.]MCW8817067.1 GTP cyclohydrolase I FolE [Ignavibacteriaceae bacterium]MCW8962141.1 GTP cyclohydrolase I FolE [Ignavibacteriaceae bacterium]MCW9094650.1 GTP cyclohydrolase I FolE [Ignavibacteriaceae bacterium]
MDNDKVKNLIYDLLKNIGEDPKREGLLDTPKRVTEAYEFLTSGYHKKIEEVMNDALFNEKYDEMVLVKNIDFYSLCEHHMLPFYGKVHVAYIPDGKIIGLSKIPRIVDVFARRLQVQERMTQQIADTLEHYLQPRGVAVVSEAFHMCMMMRGVQKQNSSATSSAVHGDFKDDPRTRAEFLNLISQKNL